MTTTGPVFLNRDELLAKRNETRDHGYLFRLNATSLEAGQEIVARVRMLDIADKAALNALPQDVQAAVWDAIKTQDKEQDILKTLQTGEAKSLDQFSERGRHVLKIADKMIIASFIEPRVVATEADLATHPGAYLPTDIAASDRLEFLTLQSGNDPSEVTRKLIRFRPGPGPDVAVDGVEQTAPQPTPGAAILRSESDD